MQLIKLNKHHYLNNRILIYAYLKQSHYKFRAAIKHMQRPRLLRALRRFAAANKVAQNASPKRTKYPGHPILNYQMLKPITVAVKSQGLRP